MEALLKKLEELNAKFESAVGNVEILNALKAEMKTLQEDYIKMKVEIDGHKEMFKSNKTIPGLELEKNKFSLMPAIRSISTKSWKDAGFELEIFQNTANGKDGIN